MSDHSEISWTDATWNPVVGCTHVSDGCDRCYAARLASGRLKNTPTYVGLAADGLFNGQVRLLPERLAEPYKWRSPKRVFVTSMGDLFHDSVPDGFIAWVFYVMAQCPQHTFQVLTKRHARMRSFMQRWADTGGDRQCDKPNGMPPMPRGPEAVRATYTSGRFAEMLEQWGQPPEGAAYPLYDWMEGLRFWAEVPFNVWLGVSVEDQRWADIRVPALLDTPAAVRFLSCEPLIGPVRLRSDWLPGVIGSLSDDAGLPTLTPSIDWLIAGGESGRGARPMHPQWAEDLRDQCTAANVAYHFKQWGEWAPGSALSGKGSSTNTVVLLDGRTVPFGQYHARSQHPLARAAMHDPRIGAGATVMHRPGKHVAGRELDGRTWDEYPGVPRERVVA